MDNALLVTTSTEGLQPLGSAPQRSYELVSGTLKDRLGPRYADLLGEPVANQAGDRIDWYAPFDGEAVALSDLPGAEQGALRARLGAMIGDIRQEAARLGQSDAPRDLRLAEALRNATEVPDETMIHAVRDQDGTRQPVLVHWAWVRNEQAAVRGVLTGMIPREPAPPPPVPANPGARTGWWWLILLGWLALALMLGAILYLLITPCGVNRFGLVFCPEAPGRQVDAFEQAAVTGDENARLLRELALAERTCRPVIPVLPATPGPVLPEFPVPVPAVPAVPPPVPTVPTGQPDETKTEADRARARDAIARRGARLGGLNFVLQWDSIDDIDLYVTCPAGQTISYSNRQACGGRYDLDANVAEATAITDPAENIVFENAVPGLYKVRAQLRSNRTEGPKTVALHVLRRDGVSQSYSGIVDPGRGGWSVNINFSR